MANLNPHPSLPARPPQATFAAPPARQGSQGQRPFPPAATPSSFAGFTPRSVAARAPAPQMSAAPVPAASQAQMPHTAGGYAPNTYPSANAYYQQQQVGYGTTTPSYPFATAGTGPRGHGRTGTYDPEEEAAIAAWSNAYSAKDDVNKKSTFGNPNTTALGSRAGDSPATPDAEAISGPDGATKGKQKTVVREGGGKTWEDSSLLEWDPLHPRLFVGNLAGEVTDDSLMKAFSRYPSVSKARVVRDKKTTKSKSYGFVSFANTDDYFRAAKEMEGKYIGSHPVRIKRANTEINATTKRDERNGRHGKNNRKGKGGNDGGGSNGLVISGAPTYNSGIHKFSQKNKGGPRVLG